MWRAMLQRAAGGRAGQPAGPPTAGQASVRFAFEDREVSARPGQSVAAALLAHGIRTLRTDEAGRPKGVLCGIGYCFECRCIIDDEPDRRACMVEARAGMRVRRQRGLA